MPDFLLEIGCEEIPARMIDAACEELARRVTNLLRRETLGETATGISTPRRLAVQADVIARQPDTESWSRGPSAEVAYKDGLPTRAAQAFAAKCGIRVEDLKIEDEYVVAAVTRKGRTAADVLAEFLPKEIDTLYWPKNMYWRKPNERFVRPVRWSSMGFGQGRLRAGTEFYLTAKLRFRAPGLLMWILCGRPRFWDARSVSSRFARLSTQPRARFPGRAGGKIRRYSIR